MTNINSLPNLSIEPSASSQTRTLITPFQKKTRDGIRSGSFSNDEYNTASQNDGSSHHKPIMKSLSFVSIHEIPSNDLETDSKRPAQKPKSGIVSPHIKGKNIQLRGDLVLSKKPLFPSRAISTSQKNKTVENPQVRPQRRNSLTSRSMSLDVLTSPKKRINVETIVDRLEKILNTFENNSTQKVVLVGNETNVFDSLIESLGYSVVRIGRGEEAIDFIRDGTEKILLLFFPMNEDHHLALNFIDDLKLHNILLDGFPLIVLSTDPVLSNSIKDELMERGAMDVLSLPLSNKRLQSRMKYYLQYKNIKQQISSLISHVKETLNANRDNSQLLRDFQTKELKNQVELLMKQNEQLRAQVVTGGRSLTLQKEREREERHSKISKETFQTPVQMITKMIRTLTRSSNPDVNELKKTLMLILSNLSQAADLFSPRIDHIIAANLNEKWNKKDQEMAKQFIVTDFTKKSIMTTRSRSTSTNSSPEHSIKIPGVPLIENYEKGLAVVSNWDCYVWDYGDDELYTLICTMFMHLNLLDQFNIDIKKMNNFIRNVRKKYQDNPYHNFKHAFDVTNCIFLLLQYSSLKNYITSLDVLGLMIGALCHDVDHPGLNNAFQVNAKTELALLYNDQAVLEQHHASTTWRLLESPDSDILSGLAKSEQAEFRKIMIGIILATDMTIHFELLARLSSRLDNPEPIGRESAQDRELICKVILHAADISNLCRPYEISKRWSDTLYEEMLQQGDEEKLRGLPVSPYMDRDDSDQCKLTLNFVDFIVLPLFKKIQKFLPELNLTEQIEKNRARWAESKLQHGNILSKPKDLPSEHKVLPRIPKKQTES